MNPTEQHVLAVTVTYRRPDLLPSLIEAVRDQTRPPDGYVLVDNGGDVPAEVEDGFVEILHPGRNLGPAGGYAAGLRAALDRDADRIWVLDDDAIPDRDCLERLLASDADVVQPAHRREHGSQRWLPWLGTLFSAEAVRRAGFPRVEYFYGSEDYEFLLRVRRAGARTVRLPDELVTHVEPARRHRGDARDWRLYYRWRNALDFRLRVRDGGLAERLRLGWGLAKTAAAIVFLEGHKRRSLGLLARAVGDYRRGELGRPIDPETWPET